MEEKKVKNVDFESQLERFRHIQETMRRIYQTDTTDIELLDVTNDYVPIDEGNNMWIEKVPLKGDDVILTVYDDKDEDKSIESRLPLSTFSQTVVSKVLNVMHRALIIEEIRNHVEY